MSDASDNDFFDDICSRVGDLVCLWVCVGVYRGERLMTDQEINEAIAVKLGWATDGTDWYSPQGLKCNMAGNLPDYCHSIAAAWEIVEKFRGIKDHQIVLSSCLGGAWVCKWVTYRMGEECVLRSGEADEGYARADTAPMAIALCFLKLKEV